MLIEESQIKNKLILSIQYKLLLFIVLYRVDRLSVCNCMCFLSEEEDEEGEGEGDDDEDDA